MLALTASGLLTGSTARAGGGDLPVVGRWPGHLRGSVQAVVVQGDRAYCVFYQGLVVFDVSDSERPRPLGDYRTRACAYDLAVSGNYAYLMNGCTGLEVLDVSDPSYIRAVSVHPELSGGSVTLSGNTAFLTGGGALQVVSLLDPTNPQVVGIHEPGGSGLALSGSHAFLTTPGEWDSDTGTWVGRGLKVLDITDLTAPRQVGFHGIAAKLQTVAVSGRHAYVADPETLHVVDVSDPANPRALAELALSSAVSIEVSGTCLYVAREAGEEFQVIDVSDPANPRYVGGYDGPGGAADLALWKDRVCLVGKDLLFLDVQEPGSPAVVGQYTIAHSVVRVAASGGRAYLAEGELAIIDVSDPAQPRKAGGYHPAAWDVFDVAIGDGHAFIKTGNGIEAIDVANPEEPQRVGSYAAEFSIGGLVLAEDHVYAATWTTGLQILDVSDPASLVLAGAYEDVPGGRPSEVAVSGNLACVAAGSAGLWTFDVSDPADPQPLGSIDALTNVFTVAVSGNHAVAGDSYSLQVIDIGDPSNPQRVGGCQLDGYANDVAVSGEFAYVAAQGAGLVVLDISDPTHPRMVAGNSSFTAFGVAVDGDKVYVAATNDGLMIFDAFPLPWMSAGLPQTPGGRLTLTVSGRPGHRVRLQRSDDLRIWEDFDEVTLGDDPASVEEVDASLPSHRFYRAVKE